MAGIDKCYVASGVIHKDADGVDQHQRARVVCVAGNAIETPRLLLLSSSEKFRDGLANSAGHVGRNYMTHTSGATYAVMPGEVHADRGTQQGGIVMDEAPHRADREFVGGFLLEIMQPSGPLGFAQDAKPGAWGRQYARDIEAYRNVAGLFIVGEDLPQRVNSVTLDPKVRDHYGLPVVGRLCCGLVLEFFELRHFQGNSTFEFTQLLPSFYCSNNGGWQCTRVAHQREVMSLSRH